MFFNFTLIFLVIVSLRVNYFPWPQAATSDISKRNGDLQERTPPGYPPPPPGYGAPAIKGDSEPLAGGTFQSPGGRSYILGQLLGSGGFGKVYRGVQITGSRQQDVVIEIVRAQHNCIAGAQEQEGLNRVNNKVLDVLATFPAAGAQVIVYPLVGDGSTVQTESNNKIFRTPNVQTNTQNIKRIVNQIAVAVGTLHSQNPKIRHRDIKPGNLLVTSGTSAQSNVFLSDFDLATTETTESSRAGTPGYMAPEVVAQTPYSPQKADVWSLGATVVQMITGKPPFGAQPTVDVLNTVAHAAAQPNGALMLRAAFLKSLSPEVCDILAKVFMPHDQRTMTAAELGVALNNVPILQSSVEKRDTEKREPGNGGKTICEGKGCDDWDPNAPAMKALAAQWKVVDQPNAKNAAGKSG